MTKKSMKSKSIVKRQKPLNNTLSYDRYSFTLDNKKILTDYLNPQTKKLLLKLYRSKKLNKLLKKNKKNYYPNSEQYIVLTEIQAIQIIKHIALRKKRLSLKKQFKKNDLFMKKVLKQSQQKTPAQQNNNYQKYKNFLNQMYFTLYRQIQHARVTLKQQKLKTEDKLRQFMQRKILSVETQLFVDSIVMIIEEKGYQKKDDQEKQYIHSIVVFQQAYPPKKFVRKDLLKIIGKQNYKVKRSCALKLYQSSVTQQNFLNPYFTTCHDCMRVVVNTGFPQHDLHCLKTIKNNNQKNVHSQLMITPQKFLDKFVNHEFFNDYSQQSPFEHPYMQYHVKIINQEGLACGRNWCGQCKIKNKKGMSMKHCDFCDCMCQCFRCRKYEKFIHLLGYYLKLRGRIDQIQQKFIFNKVFNNPQNTTINDQDFTTKRMKDYLFKQLLKKMYHQKMKDSDFIKSEEWLLLRKQQILSGVFSSQDVKKFSSPLFHKDQMRKKNKDHIEKLVEIQRKNYQKYANERKQQNIEAKISKLDESVKSRILKAHLEQFMVLKRKLQKSKILRSTNPLNSQRSAIESPDVMIVSESSLRKNHRKFCLAVEVIEMNPLNRIKQEREYHRIKRTSQVSQPNTNVCAQKRVLEKPPPVGQSHKQQRNPAQSSQNNKAIQEQNYNSMWQ